MISTYFLILSFFRLGCAIYLFFKSYTHYAFPRFVFVLDINSFVLTLTQKETLQISMLRKWLLLSSLFLIKSSSFVQSTLKVISILIIQLQLIFILRFAYLCNIIGYFYPIIFTFFNFQWLCMQEVVFAQPLCIIYRRLFQLMPLTAFSYDYNFIFRS